MTTVSERPAGSARAATPMTGEPFLQPAAIRAVLYREWRIFTRLWLSMSFGSVLEPLVYLLAFGFGFGALVTEAVGIPYLDFVATGVVATAVLFQSCFGAMFTSFFRRKYQHTYDGVLAAPVSVRDVVTAEATWWSLRCAAVALVPIGVGMAFGLRPLPPAFVLVPLVAALTGFGFSLFGISVAAVLPSINSVDYVISGIVTPMFLVAGTFFPLDGLPDWARIAAQVNPLYHCVELVRLAVFGGWTPSALGHVALLVAFVVVGWVVAVRLLQRAVID